MTRVTEYSIWQQTPGRGQFDGGLLSWWALLLANLRLKSHFRHHFKSLINAFWVGLAMMTSQGSHFSVVKVQPAYITSNVEATYLQETSILLLDSLSSNWSQLVWEAFTRVLECLHCLPSYFGMSVNDDKTKNPNFFLFLYAPDAQGMIKHNVCLLRQKQKRLF